VHTLAASFAGLVAALASTPVDRAKTLLMTDRQAYGSVFSCLLQIGRTRGFAGLYQGFLATWMRLGPWAFLFFVCFGTARDLDRRVPRRQLMLLVQRSSRYRAVSAARGGPCERSPAKAVMNVRVESTKLYPRAQRHWRKSNGPQVHASGVARGAVSLRTPTGLVCCRMAVVTSRYEGPLTRDAARAAARRERDDSDQHTVRGAREPRAGQRGSWPGAGPPVSELAALAFPSSRLFRPPSERIKPWFSLCANPVASR
jgi:hypothetical protein